MALAESGRTTPGAISWWHRPTHSPSGWVAATPWLFRGWLTTPMGGRPPIVFNFFFKYIYNVGFFLVILIVLQLKYMSCYQTKD